MEEEEEKELQSYGFFTATKNYSTFMFQATVVSAQYIQIFLSKTLLIQVPQISLKEMRMHFVFFLYGLNLHSQFSNNKLYFYKTPTTYTVLHLSKNMVNCVSTYFIWACCIQFTFLSYVMVTIKVVWHMFFR